MTPYPVTFHTTLIAGLSARLREQAGATVDFHSFGEMEMNATGRSPQGASPSTAGQLPAVSTRVLLLGCPLATLESNIALGSGPGGRNSGANDWCELRSGAGSAWNGGLPTAETDPVHGRTKCGARPPVLLVSRGE